MGKIIFITGTDTGIGKTVFTALFLQYLREKKIRALAMKPFCSGSRRDVKILQSLQRGELSDEEMNPYFFPEPLAPFVAARKEGRKITLPQVLRHIDEIKKHCDVLLIEGAGGVMVPLGEDFLVKDLIQKLGSHVVLVARNRLGVLNHVLLSVLALKESGVEQLAIILMNAEKSDLSSRTNRKVLARLLPFASIFSVPFLGRKIQGKTAIKNNCKKIKKTLARIYAHV